MNEMTVKLKTQQESHFSNENIILLYCVVILRSPGSINRGQVTSPQVLFLILLFNEPQILYLELNFLFVN